MVGAIIQARMGSTRLQGKVMKEILGKPLLWHLMQRIGNAKMIDTIVLATTANNTDNRIAEFAQSNNFKCSRT